MNSLLVLSFALGLLLGGIIMTHIVHKAGNTDVEKLNLALEEFRWSIKALTATLTGYSASKQADFQINHKDMYNIIKGQADKL